MKALVIYESMFGNTRVVAGQIAAGLREHLPTELVEVGEAPQEVAGEVTLVVLGGPTHALGMSRPATRTDAAQQGGGCPAAAAPLGRQDVPGSTQPRRASEVDHQTFYVTARPGVIPAGRPG